MNNLVALPSGTVLAGDFRINRVLGAGGFGITYLADDLALARQVTIKEYFPVDYAVRKNDIEAHPRSRECAADYKWGLERFIEEAQTLAKFVHPNIVGVFRRFKENNTGYMVLNFEQGGSLKAWLRGLGRAPRQSELDQILGPLLDALEYIHDRDFLHRDIAPDNIMIRNDKTPVLIDFGSARGEIAQQSRTVSALVKPGYSPYEQYASTTRQQGPWTDIYALGATFYQAISGKRPPDSPSRMVTDDYVPAREAAIGSFRVGFLAAIDKSLRLEVTERPQSIAGWRTALFVPDPKVRAKPARARIGEVLGLKPSEPEEPLHVTDGVAAIQPPPPDAPQPAGQFLDYIDGLRKPAKARPAKAEPAAIEPVAAAKPASASLSIALAAASEPIPVENAGRFGLGYGGSPTLAAARAAKSPAQPVPSAISDLQPPLPRALPAALPAVLPQPIERRKPKRQRQLWFFLRSPWRGLIAKFAVGVAVATVFTMYQDRLAQFAPRGAQVTSSGAVTRSDSRKEDRADSKSEAQAETGTVLQPSSQQLTGPTGTVKALLFLGQSRRVATIGADATLRVWDAATGAQTQKISLPEGPATAFAAQDSLALTGHADGTLALWDLAKGERVAVFKRGTAALTAVAFAPEGDRLIAAGSDGCITVWNRKAPATPLFTSEGNALAVTALVRVSARDAIAYALPDKTIRLAKSEGLAPIRNYRGHAAAVTAVDSPEDGRALASAAADGQIRLWSTASNRLVRSFKGHAGSVIAISYAPSGDTLASVGADGYLKVWDAKRGRLIAASPRRATGVRAIAVAADGRRIATAEDDGSVRLWDAANLTASRE